MKRILLAVSGLNPQVITEALYCLQQEQRFVDGIHIITTRKGRELLLSRLLDGGEGKLYQFFSEYGVDRESVDFHPGNIYTIQNENGIEADDIVSQEDNENLLRLCLELTFDLTGRYNCALYFLVAGGRKTMTSCLSVAAQLYGRQQDRIYHVLVSPEFESNRDFWYPPKESVQVELTDRNGEQFYKESHYAKLQLIPIPFVSLRDKLEATMLAKPHSPGTLLTSLVKDEDRILEISLRRGTLTFGTVQMDMLPARLALFAFFCEVKKRCEHRLKDRCRDCTDCFLTSESVFNQQDKITSIYKQICNSRCLSEMSDTGIINLNNENFNSYKSKIKKDLQSTFGAMAADLIITSTGKRPETRYGIGLCRRKIFIEW